MIKRIDIFDSPHLQPMFLNHHRITSFTLKHKTKCLVLHIHKMPTSTSNSNSNSNSNPLNSRNNSSNASRSRSPFGGPVLQLNTVVDAQTGEPGPHPHQDSVATHGYHHQRGRPGLDTSLDESSPSILTHVYIVTSDFTSQIMSDGVRLSESDIIGFQILAVFAKLEDANSYAEHECEEIDAGVRRRRARTLRSGAVGASEGDGIRAEAIVRDDGTVSWNVEDIGQIEVGQWVVQ